MKNLIKVTAAVLMFTAVINAASGQRRAGRMMPDSIRMERMRMHRDSIPGRHMFPGAMYDRRPVPGRGMVRHGMAAGNFRNGMWAGPGMGRGHGFGPGYGMRHGFGGEFGYGHFPRRFEGPGVRPPFGARIESIPGLTDKQKNEINELRTKQREEMKKFMEEREGKMKEMREEHRKKMMDILTDEQKKFLDGSMPADQKPLKK